MESEANYKMLKQMTKRERKGGKRKDAIKASNSAAATAEDKPEKALKKPMPGAKYIKMLTSSTSVNIMAFGAACIAIIYYGDAMAEVIEQQVPSEKAILEVLKQQQEMMMPPPM